MQYDASLHLIELRQRAERVSREANLRATLPAAVPVYRPKPLARHVRPLADVVEIRRPAPALAPDAPQAA
jgi:hypothetical protein